MKKVHTNDMVAHLWANKSQDEARTASGNYYFTGPTLFSYGSHYVCGHWTDWNYRGKPVLLVNGGTYSRTTSSKHMPPMWRALSGHRFHAFALSELKGDMVRSSRMWRHIADQAIADARQRLESSARYHSIHKVRQAWTAAHELVTLAQIACDNAPKGKESAAAIKRIRAAVPDMPEALSDDNDLRVWQKALRDRLKRDSAKQDAAKHAEACTSQFCAVFGWADANGVKLASNKFQPVQSIYTRTAPDALERAERAHHERYLSVKAAKLINARPPRMPSEKVIKALIEALRPIAFAAKRAETVRNCEYAVHDYYMAKRRRDARPFDSYRPLRSHEAPVVIEGGTARERAIVEQYNAVAMKAIRAAGVQRVRSHAERAHAEIISATSYLPRWEADASRCYQTALNYVGTVQGTLHKLDLGERQRAYFLSLLPDYKSVEAWLADWQSREAERNAAAIVAWQNGEGNYSAARRLADYPLLRINGDNIESSWGAYMPCAQAGAVWRVAQIAMRTGRDIECPPHEPVVMGSFKLSRARADGSIVAGCHDIPAQEIRRVAALLNLPGAVA